MEQEIILPPYDIKMIAEEIRDDEIEEIPGALETGKAEIDPVTFSVVLARMEGIMSEMTATILATARNPILYGAKDYTCTMMNAKAKVFWIYDCLPAHVGSLQPTLRWLIRVFKGDIKEGDVFVNNASYSGNAHVGDWTMFAPVFYKGKFLVWVINKCHLIDTGGPRPTNLDPYARDIYEEPLSFPGVRLCRDHKMIPDLIRFIGFNFRYPRQWYGDFLAQLGSLWVAESRMIELCDRFGYDTVKGCVAECLRYGDRLMTEEIKKLPKIAVEEEMLGEKIEGFCPDGLKFKMKLSIDPDKALITIDYREMPDNLPWGYNLSYATTLVTAIEGTMATLGLAVRNDGVFDRIKVLMREGAMVGPPRFPIGNSVATTSINDEVANLVCKTWAKVVPERALAGMGEFSAVYAVGSGVDPRLNEPYGHMYFLASSGGGATEGYDGLPQMVAPCVMGNMGNEFIETFELAVPQIVWSLHAVTDSGGAGKWKGAPATGQVIQPWKHDMRLISAGTGHTNPPFGLFGGLPGIPADHWIIDHATGEVVEHLANMGDDVIKANQLWHAVASGGGGFGDPLERDPEAVRDDVRDGFVSLEAARDIYGVVLNTEPELYEVDYPATEKLRAEAKKKKGRE